MSRPDRYQSGLPVAPFDVEPILRLLGPGMLWAVGGLGLGNVGPTCLGSDLCHFQNL